MTSNNGDDNGDDNGKSLKKTVPRPKDFAPGGFNRGVTQAQPDHAVGEGEKEEEEHSERKPRKKSRHPQRVIHQTRMKLIGEVCKARAKFSNASVEILSTFTECLGALVLSMSSRAPMTGFLVLSPSVLALPAAHPSLPRRYPSLPSIRVQHSKKWLRQILAKIVTDSDKA
jgi:hypothetical protein